MARLVTSGFELGEFSSAAGHPDPFSSTGITAATISTANPRSGSNHVRMPFNGAASCKILTSFTNTTAVTYSLRAYIYLSTLPAATAFQLIDFPSITAGRLSLFSDGHIAITGGDPVLATCSAGGYFRFEMQWKIDTASAANGFLTALINGVTAYTATGGMGTTLPTGVTLGAISVSGSPGAVTIDVDDVAINDSSGASQTSWPGAGKIVLLKPISDNARGTGWVNDANGATNFFDATDNTPPVGIADTTASTGLHQIRNGTSNANSSYDANLTTYTNAGIGAADTINVLDPFVATGAPVTTSAKQGTIGVSSNPAITNIALAAGGTSGAFWSGTAAGTYPTGWKWSHGTTTYAPSVTLGNSPVARITQVTSSTRIAMVCALGMYVDYTPAVTVPPRYGYVSLPDVGMLMRRLPEWLRRLWGLPIRPRLTPDHPVTIGGIP